MKSPPASTLTREEKRTLWRNSLILHYFSIHNFHYPVSSLCKLHVMCYHKNSCATVIDFTKQAHYLCRVCPVQCPGGWCNISTTLKSHHTCSCPAISLVWSILRSKLNPCFLHTAPSLDGKTPNNPSRNTSCCHQWHEKNFFTILF